MVKVYTYKKIIRTNKAEVLTTFYKGKEIWNIRFDLTKTINDKLVQIKDAVEFSRWLDANGLKEIWYSKEWLSGTLEFLEQNLTSTDTIYSVPKPHNNKKIKKEGEQNV